MVALAAAACDSGTSTDVKADGPVAFLADAQFEQAAGFTADQGKKVVFGALAIRNDGNDVATLDAARLTGPSEKVVDDGAKVVEVRALDVTGGKDLVGAGPWPFEHYQRDSVPLKGYELGSKQEAELLFVVSIDKTGHWSWPETELTYTSDGEKYRIRISTGFFICPTSDGDCNKPK